MFIHQQIHNNEKFSYIVLKYTVQQESLASLLTHLKCLLFCNSVLHYCQGDEFH